MKKSPSILSYINNHTQKTMKYFNLIGVAGREVYNVKVYLFTKFDMIHEGKCYKLQNVVQKGSENELWVTSNSKVTSTEFVETDQDVKIPPLPEETPEDGQNLSLQSAINSPRKSVVAGKVVKVYCFEMNLLQHFHILGGCY